MKKILTLATFVSSYANTHLMYESVELHTAQDGESYFEFLSHTIKQASGKYVVFFQGDFSLADVHSLINLCTKSNEDILVFNGGYAYKTTLLKAVTISPTAGFAAFDISCILAAKTITKTNIRPFVLKSFKAPYTKEYENDLLFASNEFKKAKSKLQKEVYTFVFDRLKEELCNFYAKAILAIHDKKLDDSELVAFDEKIRQNVVLYLAFEKQFSTQYLPLGELRGKKFKLGFFAVGKLKRLAK